MINPNRITLRSGLGTNYRSLGYGLVGDRVQVLTQSPPELDYDEDSHQFTPDALQGIIQRISFGSLP
ncbi:hypothetical protein [Floridanema aerugineum]|uniref:Uncharacterized protein n=1 Tax=Floridaenema aerugineum BLCC-F46 TaxID=3153654 RepID=A0ABV4XCT2_9CYAN